jgi:hypothetical protein
MNAIRTIKKAVRIEVFILNLSFDGILSAGAPWVKAQALETRVS